MVVLSSGLRRWLFIPVAGIIAACAGNPYKSTNKIYRKQANIFAKQLRSFPIMDSIQAPAYPVGTTNFNLRKPNFVIIHHTAQNSCDQTLQTFTRPSTQVSAHYVICKDGTIHHMLNDTCGHGMGVLPNGVTTQTSIATALASK